MRQIFQNEAVHKIKPNTTNTIALKDSDNCKVTMTVNCKKLLVYSII